MENLVWGRSMKRLFSATILTILILATIHGVTNSLGNTQTHQLSLSVSPRAENPVWNITDTIVPSLESVKWVEEGNYNEPPSWISDGRWYEAHVRQTLVNSEDIFVAFSEVFNWTAVNEGFSQAFASFDEFKDRVSSNPGWWLNYSWGIDMNWHGVPLNKTRMSTEFDVETSKAELSIWCHITNIPEYIVGGKRLETWLTGFDLTAISIGNLKAFQWYEDYAENGRYYYIYFEAPAKLLSQHRDTYSLVLEVSPLYVGQTYDVEQRIQISMPPNTEVQSTNPPNMSKSSENIVTFTVHEGDVYPATYSVTSGPPIKDPTKSLVDSLYAIVTDPTKWVALGALITLTYTGFRGRQIWGRRKTYYRLYKTMVNTYDRFCLNFPPFSLEMENLSRTITQYFIEDKITDDQLDKLLARRDHLLESARKLQPPRPPQP